MKCGAVQPLSEYYKHRMMRDGHLNKCKRCTRTENAANRSAKLSYYQAYDRVRYAHHGHRGEPTREAKRRKSRAWYARNREKCAAVTKLNRAVRAGKLVVPNRCSLCRRKTSDLQAHHADYAKPLDVQWFCVKCHNATHRKNDVRADLAVLAQGPLAAASG